MEDMEDIGEVEEKNLRQKYIKAAKTAPAKVFADGKNGMTSEEVRTQLIKYYKDCDILELMGNEQYIEEWTCSMMDEKTAMRTALKLDAINIRLLRESAIMARFYTLLDKAQQVRDIELDVYYSKIVDWSIDLYDNSGKTEIAHAQHPYEIGSLLIVQGALETWMKAVREQKEEEKL